MTPLSRAALITAVLTGLWLQEDTASARAQQPLPANLSDFAVVLAGSFSWARLGSVEANGTALELAGFGLRPVHVALAGSPPLASLRAS